MANPSWFIPYSCSRIIKVLKPKYVNVVMAAIQELLTNSEIRTKTIDIEG
jgi:hypothetical protein